MKRHLIAGLLLLLGCSASLAEEDLSCGSEAVRRLLQSQAAERLCLNDNLRLSDVVWSLSVDGGGLGLADLITTRITEVPLARGCEAQLSYDLTLTAEALGPGPGIPLRFSAGGKPRTVTYTVGRYDDGRLYVRPDPGCWRLDSLQSLR